VASLRHVVAQSPDALVDQLVVHQLHGLLPCSMGITGVIKRGFGRPRVERRRPTFLTSRVREM
jgi:hypothetical protein